MYRCMLIDDEPLARQRVRDMLSVSFAGQIAIMDEASDGIEALEKIESLQPDFIILDIQMPGLSGFEVLMHLKKVPPVIFATAYDHYAIRAFEVNAVDYLLKPFDEERLKRAIERIIAHLKVPESASTLSIQKLITDAIQEKNTQTAYLERIPYRDGEKIRFIKAAQCLWFDTQDSVTYLHTDQSAHDIRYTLDEIEQRLRPSEFLRVHRATIVNLNAIREMTPWFNGAYKIILNDKKNSEIDVARGRVQALRDVLGW